MFITISYDDISFVIACVIHVIVDVLHHPSDFGIAVAASSNHFCRGISGLGSRDRSAAALQLIPEVALHAVGDGTLHLLLEDSARKTPGAPLR